MKNEKTLTVTVIPRSSKTEVTELSGGELRVKLTAPPVDGTANDQLIEILSERFSVAKRRIVIVRGLASRRKLVRIEGPDREGK